MNLSRRWFLRLCTSAGAGIALGQAFGSRQALAADAAKRPNVLFIAIDDLNDYVGCLGGHPQTKTPNLDALADQSTLFANAHCPAPACLPSRTAIMTGLAPYTTGVYVNEQHWRTVLPKAVTLPKYFMNHGYYCAGAGKIFHHYQNDPESWHDYYPTKTLQFPKTHKPPKDKQADFPRWPRMYTAFNWGPLDVPDEKTGDYQSVKYVSDRLGRKHDKPFFLTCGIYRPHLPWFVPKKYFDMFPLDKIKLPPIKDDDADDLPKAGKGRVARDIYYQKMVKYGKRKEALQAYLASAAYADAMVGRLLENLAASPNADNTIVVLWSDHGWHLGEKQCYRKFTLWEESCRVPLMIRLPRSMQSGFGKKARCDQPVNLLDLYPTLIELCGLPRRGDLDGHSLVPLLKAPDSPWPYASITTHGHNAHSLRTRRWRYLRYADGGEELYDHKTDPNEWRNLAGDKAHAKIKQKMIGYLPKVNKPLVKTPNYDAKKAAREAYESLRQNK